MSTEYDIACMRCKVKRHLGQRFSSGWRFGYGSNDDKGREALGDFIGQHAGHDLRVYWLEDARLDDDVVREVSDL